MSVASFHCSVTVDELTAAVCRFVADCGATVSVIEQESQDKRQYTLVGQDEADMKFNRISIQSPVGRALIGKRVGDFIEVQTPVKTVEYEVVEIKFEEL